MSGRISLVPIAGAALALMLTVGCHKNRDNTSLVTVRLQDLEAPFTKIFVMGVGENDQRRRLYEDSLVSALKEKGVAAQASYEVFPEEDKLERGEVLTAVTAGGFDAVAVTHLIWVTNEVEYVPHQGRVLSVPSGNADVYLRANTASLYIATYHESYDAHHTPGYYKTNRTYSVETMVFSVPEGGTKVWSALSETVNPASVERLIDSVVAVVVRGMKEDGVVN